MSTGECGCNEISSVGKCGCHEVPVVASIQSNDLMKYFPNKKFKALTDAVKKINAPIDSDKFITKVALEFFGYLSELLPSPRDRSTGRHHEMKSCEADFYFGTAWVQQMVVILHKLTAKMAGDILAGNNDILTFYVKTLKKGLQLFISTNPDALKNESAGAESKEDSQETVVTPEELETFVLQCFTLFITRKVNVKQKNKSAPARNTIILHSVIAYLKKLSTAYKNTIVARVLDGSSKDVDLSLKNTQTYFQFNLRKSLHSPSTRANPLTSVTQFHMIAQGEPWFGQRLAIGTEPTRIMTNGKGLVQKKPFLNIETEVHIDANKVKRCLPTWSNGQPFFVETIESIKQQAQCLTEIQKEVFMKLLQIQRERMEGPHLKGDITFGLSLKEFMETNMLMQVHDNYELKLSIFNLLCTWDDSYDMDAIFNNLGLMNFGDQQPKLSVKMTFIGDFMEQALKQVDRCVESNYEQVSKDFLEHMRYKLDRCLTKMVHIVRSSPLNTALVSILNHAEFVSSDPLRDFVSGKYHDSAKALSENIGCVRMAYMVQAGLYYFDSKQVTTRLKPPPTKSARSSAKKGRVQQDEDSDTPFEKSEEEGLVMNSIQKAIRIMEDNKELPKADDLSVFLKKAFSDMTMQDFKILQSMLEDLYILQPFTRQLDYKEEVQVNRANTVPKQQGGPTVDLSTATSDSDDDGLRGMTFQPISSRKVAVNATQSFNTKQRDKVTSNTATQATIVSTPGMKKAATPGSNKSYASGQGSVNGKVTQKQQRNPTFRSNQQGNLSDSEIDDNTAARNNSGKMRRSKGDKNTPRRRDWTQEDDEEDDDDNDNEGQANRSASKRTSGKRSRKDQDDDDDDADEEYENYEDFDTMDSDDFVGGKDNNPTKKTRAEPSSSTSSSSSSSSSSNSRSSTATKSKGEPKTSTSAANKGGKHTTLPTYASTKADASATRAILQQGAKKTNNTTTTTTTGKRTTRGEKSSE